MAAGLVSGGWRMMLMGMMADADDKSSELIRADAGKIGARTSSG